jgi:hypothetical protein
MMRLVNSITQAFEVSMWRNGDLSPNILHNNPFLDLVDTYPVFTLLWKRFTIKATPRIAYILAG